MSEDNAALQSRLDVIEEAVRLWAYQQSAVFPRQSRRSRDREHRSCNCITCHNLMYELPTNRSET
jgi:hypothetical protein